MVSFLALAMASGMICVEAIRPRPPARQAGSEKLVTASGRQNFACSRTGRPSGTLRSPPAVFHGSVASTSAVAVEPHVPRNRVALRALEPLDDSLELFQKIGTLLL